MEHVAESVVLQDDDAVTFGVALGLDEPKTGSHLLGTGEVLVGFLIFRTYDVTSLRKVHCVGILRRDIDLGVGKLCDAFGVIAMLVGNEDFGHLLRLVAQCSERRHIVVHLVAHVEWCAQLLGWGRHAGLEARVDEDDTFVGLDEEVLERAAIDDLLVEHVLTFLSAKGERLMHEAVVIHAHGLDSFDFHNNSGFKMTQLQLAHHNVEHHHQHKADGKADGAEIGVPTAGGFGYQFLDDDVEHGACGEGEHVGHDGHEQRGQQHDGNGSYRLHSTTQTAYQERAPLAVALCPHGHGDDGPFGHVLYSNAQRDSHRRGYRQAGRALPRSCEHYADSHSLRQVVNSDGQGQHRRTRQPRTGAFWHVGTDMKVGGQFVEGQQESHA